VSKVTSHAERYVVFYALLGLGLGLAIGTVFPPSAPLAHIFRVIVDIYGAAAPFILFFILAPSLLKMVRQGKTSGALFSIYTTLWFARLRIAACLFAIVAVSIVYGLPFFGRDAHYDTSQLLTSLGIFARTATTSRYFYVIYASILTTLLLRRSSSRIVEKFIAMPELVERLGVVLTHVVPLFTFAMGLYVATLPRVLKESFSQYENISFHEVSILGVTYSSTTTSGIFGIYVTVAVLTGVICSVWQLTLLVYVRLKVRGFSIASYFRNYFIKVYPLLWATSSEALSTPLNMHLIKKNFPQINDAVRQFTIGAGSVLNVNGTLICCFVMIPPVSMMLGLDVSVVSLLLCLPVIYIIGFGIPGIPGELVLFAGPIMGMLAVPQDLQPAFLMTFLGLQVGLPDSFRTGANSTDGCPAALLLNEIYERRFSHVPLAELVPEESGEANGS
jgi:hypothetical protein